MCVNWITRVFNIYHMKVRYTSCLVLLSHLYCSIPLYLDNKTNNLEDRKKEVIYGTSFLVDN